MEFLDLPIKDQLLIDSIKDKTVQKLYSQQHFKYFSYNGNNNTENIIHEDSLFKNFLSSFLEKFKLITFEINKNINYIKKVNSNIDSNSSSQIVDIIFVAESNCIIIKQIKISLISQIMQYLTEKNIVILNFSLKSCQYPNIPQVQNDDTDYFQSIYSNFNHEIKNNKFVAQTICPIFGFIIKRYFYPTYFFSDPSFFTYKNTKKPSFSMLDDFLFSQNTNKLKNQFINEIKKDNNELINENFQEKDFIFLKNLNSNISANFILVLHIETLYIFVLKKMNISRDNYKEYNREIEFNKKYSHQCLNKFYGFVKDKEQIAGFIYEYLCNGTLHSFILDNNKKENNKIHLLTIIIRIFRGIEYLHKNLLIYRDLKPYNVLLDHDFVPYIIDFETIRHPLSTDEHNSNEKITANIGTFYFASPEQFDDNNTHISYPTDIFSFGATIYYLIEKKTMNFSNNDMFYIMKEYDVIPKMNQGSSNLQKLYESCVVFQPEKRIKCQDIKKMIINEGNSIKYDDNLQLTKQIVSQFFYENIKIRCEEKDELNKFFDNIYLFQCTFLKSLNIDESFFLMHLGDLYFYGLNVTKNYLKAKNYYEISAYLNNSYSLNMLGNIYFEGVLGEKNYHKAKNFYILSAKLKNAAAFVNLGYLYFYGFGVRKDYLEAKYYYEVAANLNNSNALMYLGDIYYFGLGVEQNFAKAKNFYEQSAKLNNSKSLEKIGDLYYEGKGVKSDYVEAKKYYEKASELENSSSLIKLGYLYHNGQGVKQDNSMFIHYLELSSQLNNDEAQCILGEMYLNGHIVKKDYLKAKEYFELSASSNNSDSLNYLGCMYYLGFGVDVDYLKARELYELSANLKNPYALNNLGNIYFYGDGVKKNYNMAREYYELSSHYHNSNALCNLGNFYYYGYGVDVNYEIAFAYYEEAAKMNDSNALNQLGNIYFNGYGVTIDYNEALKYYELAASNDNSNAYNNLGNLYKNGLGVEINYEKALTYYEVAASLNNHYAYNNLGNLYYNGYGVEIDYSLAKEYYELAAEQNNSSALNNLGIIYENGDGVDVDYNRAREYYELAAAQNNSNALNNLGILYENGDGVEKDYKIAKEYYERAADLNNGDAYENLGDLYYSGRGVKRNYEKAKKCYELAVQNNNTDAKYKLKDVTQLLRVNLNFGMPGIGTLHFDKNGDYQLIRHDQNALLVSLIGDANFYGRKNLKQDFSLAKKSYETMIELNDPEGYCKLGVIYHIGYGVKINYEKAKYYYEMAAKRNNSDGLNNLGVLYYNGFNDHYDYEKAKEYYESSIKKGNSYALINLGVMYCDKFSLPFDLYKAIYLFEKALNNGNSFASLYLGNLYYNGSLIKQDYLKAKHYYELSAKEQNSYALNALGKMYENGFGVQKDYLIAKHYYELAAKKGNSDGFYNIGFLYENGLNVEKSVIKALNYYDLAAMNHNTNALFRLGYLNSTGDLFEINLNKAIQYFSECIKIHREKENFLFSNYHILSLQYKINNYYYRSFNDLGLIYINDFNDKDKALEYLKIASSNEYPFGMNNFGLLNQFYLDESQIAFQIFEKAAKSNFALSEFNLAYLKEINNEFNEAIKYYIKASEHEDEPLIFRNFKHYDKRLEISKMFIICYTNIKLTSYFLTNGNYEEAKKYFIKAFAKLKLNEKNSIYQFHFKVKKEIKNDDFLYLKRFILYFPAFNLKNQSNIEINFDFDDSKFNTMKSNNYDDTTFIDNNTVFKKDSKFMENLKKKCNSVAKNLYLFKDIILKKEMEYSKENEKDEYKTFKNEISDAKIKFLNKYENVDNIFSNNNNNNKKNFFDDEDDSFDENYNFFDKTLFEKDLEFDNPSDFFDFVIENIYTKNIFLNQINDIIQTMKSILYQEPYSILFGRISIGKSSNQKKYNHFPLSKNIDNDFYDGFLND